MQTTGHELKAHLTKAQQIKKTHKTKDYIKNAHKIKANKAKPLRKRDTKAHNNYF